MTDQASREQTHKDNLSLSGATQRVTRHLNQIELSRRWNISPRTLERWRWLGEGPQYIKIGGRVVYRLEDVEAFERVNLRQCGSRPVREAPR